MPGLSMRSLDGGTTTVAQDTLDALATRFKGQLITPDSAGYDEARMIWNAMIDRRPGVIARCATAGDVVEAVNFGREAGLLIAIRGNGHNIAGNAICDGGLVIDLSQMKTIEVDPRTKTARVAAGATLGEVDAATQAHGLAIPLGINSTTGISGLTLGGGFGWLSRKFGLTIDSLVSVDVVTADGRTLKASAKENPDLFWALRGGGGNFGIATSFEFRLHPVGPEVLAGLIVHPFNDAGTLLRKYREVAAGSPDELTTWVVMRKAPPLPFLPEDVHGKEVVVFAAVYAGDFTEGEKALARVRAIGKPIADVVGPHKYAEFQQAFDPLLAPVARNYWKSHDFSRLSDSALDTMVTYAGRLPTPMCEIIIGHLGGAVSLVQTDATAYTHRDAPHFMNVHTRWEDPKQDQACVTWARELFDKLAPQATGGVYVNFMPEDDGGRIAAAYGANFRRLGMVKKQYDPDNLFRLNQNIRPASA